MPSTTSDTSDLDHLHDLIGGLRRCMTSLCGHYGDNPAMRRLVNDAERILVDVDRLDIDAEELGVCRRTNIGRRHAEKIGIPDTQYAREFWDGVDDEGLGGVR